MITDPQTLLEELQVLNSAIANAIIQFESSVGFGAIVTLHSVGVGKDEIVPDDKVWSVTSTARIITNETNEIVTTSEQ